MVYSSFVLTWWCSFPLSLCGRGLRGGGTRKNPHQKKREEEGQSRHNKERGLRNPLTPHQKREGVSVLRWLRVCVLSQTHFEKPCICWCGGLVHTSKVGQGRYACADDRKCVCTWRWICSQSVCVPFVVVPCLSLSM